MVEIKGLTVRIDENGQRQLAESNLLALAENALQWVWEVDAAGKYTYASPSVEKILGYTSEEMLQLHFYDLFQSSEREALKKAAFKIFAAKAAFREFINENVHKDGTTIWLSTSGIPILDGVGNLLGYRGMDTDITGVISFILKHIRGHANETA